MVSPSHLVALVLLLNGAMCTTPPPDDVIKQDARQLVNRIRELIDHAREGMYLYPLHQNVLELHDAALELMERLDTEVSQCETQMVIKMAASGTASHEVLSVMLAEDELSVVNGRLALSLGFLKNVVYQLEDELPRSTNITSYLAAIVFGTNATANIVETADDKVKAVVVPAASSSGRAGRVRRQLLPGWTVGSGGVNWQSKNGRFNANVKPTFPNGLKNLGLDAAVKWQNKNGRFQTHVNPSYNKFGNHQFRVDAGAKWRSRNGRWQVNLNPSYNQFGHKQFGLTGGFSFHF